MASNQTIIHLFYEHICQENLPKVQLFGESLETYMESQKQTISFLNEPWVIRKCCGYILEKGLYSEGLFRVPGSHDTIEKLVESLNQGKNPDFDRQDVYVEDVAGVLKKYLRDLPDHLISDGSSEETLAKKFLSTLLNEKEESKFQLQMFKQLLSTLPISNLVILKELFGLFSTVIEYSEYNLMGAENIATIFGGMTTIFVSSKFTAHQRTTLVRIFINHYRAIFSDLYVLNKIESNDEESAVKEAVKIYLHDGTFKSLLCDGNETAKQITKKILTKLQHTVDATDYKIYEIRDHLIRKISSDEKILLIYKSGSGILFTNQIKSEKRKPSRRDRSKTTSAESSPLKPTTSPRGKKKTKESDRNTSIEVLHEFSAWIILTIPDPTLASSWSLDESLEGIISIVYSLDETKIIVRLNNSAWEFSLDAVKMVADSSRYYHIQGDDEQIGIGFETREESNIFREILVSLVDSKSESKLNSEKQILLQIPEEIVTSSQIFAKGPLDYMQDGFYDPGLTSENDLQDMETIISTPHEEGKREVIFVDESNDENLRNILKDAKDLIDGMGNFEYKIKMLSLYVSNVMGGIDLYGFEENSVTNLSEKTLNEIRIEANTNVVQLGNISHGVSRHRAILFKYICDRLNPSIASILCRRDTITHSELSELYWILIPSEEPNQFIYVDLIDKPGSLYLVSASEYFLRLLDQVHGKLPSST